MDSDNDIMESLDILEEIDDLVAALESGGEVNIDIDEEDDN